MIPFAKDFVPSRLFVGTSGWAYPSWKPGFYPARLPARRFLAHYGAQMNAVEVNYSFRTLPTAEQLAGWLLETPQDFRFSFKAPQRITHFSRLRGCEGSLADFLLALQPVRDARRLGPLLFQLPPNLRADPVLLRDFLALPGFRDAPPVAFEFRHPSWFADETYTALADGGAAVCIADTDELQTPEVHTAPAHTFFRLRRHGGYTPSELAVFARRFQALSREREVYAFFRHEDEPTGALNAAALRALLGEPARPAGEEPA